MTKTMRNWKRPIGCFVAVLFILCTSGCMHFFKQKPGEPPDLSQPRQSFASYSIERFNSGVLNIVTGPFEIFYQLTQETTRTNPVIGFVPGLFRGVAMFAAREVIGVFEIGTFFLPLKPHLKPFDFEWLHA